MRLANLLATIVALTLTVVAFAAPTTPTPQAAEKLMCTMDDAPAATPLLIDRDQAEKTEVRCWACRKDSKGSCGGGDKHCYGERSACSKKGCKITGSTSKCGNKSTC